ncbi:hypothetical protein C8J57DRAFT_1233713 [Mycena rebaudengoi]|nr:hypothetical protein C8J57DRAFT_1233713 [Mycena rebaudengoi]
MLPAMVQHDSPYADAQLPPPPVVMLLSATALHLPTFRPLLSQEDLTVTSAPVPKSLAFAQATEAKPGASAHTPSSRRSAPPPAAPPSERGDSPLTNMSDNENDTNGSDSDGDGDGGDVITPKIDCPKGLTCMTLAKHKAWAHGDLTNEITAHVHILAKKYLDTSEVYSNQNRTALKDVYRKAKAAYPVLKEYNNNWPTKCILQAHLKIRKNASKTAIISNFSQAIGRRSPSTKRLLGTPAV